MKLHSLFIESDEFREGGRDVEYVVEDAKDQGWGIEVGKDNERRGLKKKHERKE